MNEPEQAQQAELFRSKHHGPRLLLLPNAWDAMSARVFVAAGFDAISTTSGGVAWSLGYAGRVSPRRVAQDYSIDLPRARENFPEFAWLVPGHRTCQNNLVGDSFQLHRQRQRRRQGQHHDRQQSGRGQDTRAVALRQAGRPRPGSRKKPQWHGFMDLCTTGLGNVLKQCD